MNRRMWIAFLSIWALFGPAGEVSRAQSGSPGSAAGGGSVAAGGAARPAAVRPDPTVIGHYAPGRRAPVAMLGYSPVSLLNSRQWVKGREQFKVILDGAAYLLADEREMQMFRVAPEQYLPALGGDCVVHFVKTGRRKPGLLRHGVVHEGRLYFLSSSEHRQEFADNPQPYMDADVALDGNCPVCLVELNQEVQGQPELAVVLGGFRYFFPGAQQREMFRAQPMRYAAAAHAIAGSELPTATAATAPLPLADPSRTQPGRDAAAESSPSEPAPALGELPTPVSVALTGYCPVSILEGNRWVRGQPEFAVVHDGRRYLFAGRQQQQEFLDDPTRFVPALGGDCVVTLKEDGRRVEGSVYHAVIHRGRQYLFPSVAEKGKFKQSPDAYADVDLALGGNCAVRLVETGEAVPGKPAFTVWQGGLRYQLSGPEEVELFQRNPRKYAEADTRPSDPDSDSDSDSGAEFVNPFAQ
jgi:YHS domain-containing protein